MNESPENMAAARKLSKLQKVPLDQWLEAGLPNRNRKTRARVATELRDLLEVLPETEVAPEMPPPEPEEVTPEEPPVVEPEPAPEPEEPAPVPRTQAGACPDENH
jgi:hypothetical protein